MQKIIGLPTFFIHKTLKDGIDIKSLQIMIGRWMSLLWILGMIVNL